MLFPKLKSTYCLAVFMFIVTGSDKLWSQLDVNNPHYLEQLVHYSEVKHSFDNQVTATDATMQDNKCGLWISFEIARNWNSFSEVQKQRLQIVRSPKIMQKDTIIGNFKILYDTTGFQEPALLDNNFNRLPNTARAYVDSVGKYFNMVWNYEIDSLGFQPPPFKTGKSYYEISIEEFGGSEYGETDFTDTDKIDFSTPPRYTSYIRIENDFRESEYYSKGMAGLKVTAAHEFHHAIQVGSYGVWPSDLYFYEITSTWMEDVVFNDVNDYYQYLPVGQFAYPDIAFTFHCINCSLNYLAYSRAIWGKFIEKRYSRNVMLFTWQNIKRERSLPATEHALNQDPFRSTFRDAFREWTLWNLNTGPNSDTIKYYSEGRHYPIMRMRPPIGYGNTSRSFTDTIQALSSSYRSICLLSLPTDSCETRPKMYVMVTNLNTNPLSWSDKFGFSYELAPNGDGSYKQLANGIFVRLNVPDPTNWISQETVPTIVSDIAVYPNPFVLRGIKPLNFRLPPVSQSQASLYIFSSSMDQVVSKEVEVISQSFEPKIQWDGRDNKGNFVPSGIYIYIITFDDKQYIGKFAVVKE